MSVHEINQFNKRVSNLLQTSFEVSLTTHKKNSVPVTSVTRSKSPACKSTAPGATTGRDQYMQYRLSLSLALLLCVSTLVLLCLRDALPWSLMGSRYVSWLPSFSVEVTRVRVERAPAPAPHVIEAMARQVQQMFPQFPLAVLAGDLQSTRSADLTVDNILEGRLAAPAPPPPAPALLFLPDATPEEGSPSRTRQSDHPIATLENVDQSTDARLGPRFSASALERQKALARRKAALLAAARARYLARAPRR